MGSLGEPMLRENINIPLKEMSSILLMEPSFRFFPGWRAGVVDHLHLRPSDETKGDGRR